MPVLKNANHEKFAQCIFQGMSQRKAYRATFPRSAKWKDAAVDVNASKLFGDAKVSLRYEELQAQAVKKAIMTRERRMVRLSEIAEHGESEANQIKAIDTLNKMDGIYTQKVEMSGNVGLSIADKEALMMQRLEELRSDE